MPVRPRRPPARTHRPVAAGTPTRSGSVPQPLLAKDGWLVCYHGVPVTAAGSIYRLGLALLDRDDPTGVLARGNEWVFGPQESYERSGDVPDAVLPCGWILALLRRHVDLGAGAVAVEEQVVSLDSRRRLSTEPKTEAGRPVVALPQLVLHCLAGHLDGVVADPESLFFPAEGGGLLRATTFDRHWRRARRRVGHDELHLHDLRHAAGTLAIWQPRCGC